MAANDGELEFNTRRLKVLCQKELEFVAEHGHFNLRFTTRGSVLFTVVSAMCTALQADTELIESINSSIKLICRRCPKIELPTLSSRVTVKKAVAGTHLAADGSRQIGSKKWSMLKAKALPLLEELIGIGDAYKEVYNQGSRFRGLVPAISWSEVSPLLGNHDISLAMPDLKPKACLIWVAASAARLRAAINNSVDKHPACHVVLAVQNTNSCSDNIAEADSAPIVAAQSLTHYLVVTSLRSQLVLARVQSEDGQLLLDSSKICFTTIADVFQERYERCQHEKMVFKLFVGQYLCTNTPGARYLQLKIMDVGGRVLGSSCDTSEFVESLRHIKPVQRAHTTPSLPSASNETQTAALDDESEVGIMDLMDFEAGYGLEEEARRSAEESVRLEKELLDEDITQRNTALLRKSRIAEAAAKSQKSSVVETQNAVSQLPTGQVGLTPDELEEEALLNIVREVNKRPSSQPALGQSMSKTAQDAVDADLFGFSSSGSSDSEGAEQLPVRAKPQVKLDKLDKAWAVWQEKAVDTLMSIVKCHQRSESAIGDNGEIALVARCPLPSQSPAALLRNRGAEDDQSETGSFEVLFVHWTNPTEHEGRTVRINNRSQVVFSPAVLFGKPVQSTFFVPPQYAILVSCVGARNFRSTGRSRDTLPEDVVRFVAVARLAAMYANKDLSGTVES